MKYEKIINLGPLLQQNNGSNNSKRDKKRGINAKKHKSKRKKNYTLHYIILIILIIITITILSNTVLFNIKTIAITPNEYFTKDKATEIMGIKMGDNLFRTDIKKTAQKMLDQSVLLEEVDVVRKLPSTLDIQLKFARPVVCYRYGGRFYYFSQNNRCIEITNEPIYNVPIVVGTNLNEIKLGEYLIEYEKIDEVELILQEIDNIDIKYVSIIDVKDISHISLYYEDRLRIDIGTISDFNYKLKFSKKVILEELGEDEMGILDVQIKGDGYFRNTNDINLPF